MGVEIERKFLVVGDGWRQGAVGVSYRQGYIHTQGQATVRVRIAGQTGYLTLKGPTQNLSRLEFEYAIPVTDANQLLLELCNRPLIEKIRYRVFYREMQWEVDEFRGDNEGLILAEVELSKADQAIDYPPWIGQEVSYDARYFNANLAQYPFSTWNKAISKD
ncbi:MAG: CYTH domain-containing protein [Cyanobacteria bacterium P01_F01_bin.150]